MESVHAAAMANPQEHAFGRGQDREESLNVAITRARDHLIVIGNLDDWKKHKYFDVLARRLPVKRFNTVGAIGPAT